VLRQLYFNFIRKTEGAFSEYCDAKFDLEEYIKTKDSHVTFYFSALRHFEQCLAHLYEGVNCLNCIAKRLGGQRQFESGDESILDRVFTLHTYLKHMDKKFEEGEVPDEISFRLLATRHDGSTYLNYSHSDIANTPVWLTNDGLECGAGSLTFAELAEEILCFCGEAESIATTVPPSKRAQPLGC